MYKPSVNNIDFFSAIDRRKNLGGAANASQTLFSAHVAE